MIGIAFDEDTGHTMPVLPASASNIASAAGDITAGRLVAFPTETVYGLGADARNARAVAAIYEAKGRPTFNPLIVHVGLLAEADAIGVLDGTARLLAERFWPGPLTLVLPLRSDAGIADLVTAGLATVAVRIPSEPVALALIRQSRCAIAAPSANRSGHVSPTTAAHVLSDLGALGFTILDGGPCRHGVESAILDVSGEQPVLLRAGAVTTAEIEEAVGPVRRHVVLADDEAPIAPGQLASHYAPRLPVRLDADEARSGEALLAFGPRVRAHAGPLVNLSPRGDLVEAAMSLFAALRALDGSGARGIAVMPIPSDGLGEAINDRLRRAAAPRPSGN